ncbi:MAG: methylenetetrahydrofolate reductase [NAD(P)H] [Allorhizobium sp.]
MANPAKDAANEAKLRVSFEFFPPKSPDMEGQLWSTVEELAAWNPEFVSVTYGAGGTTRAPTLSTVRRLIADTPLPTAAHLTCVGATKDETRQVVEEFKAAGVRHFVALRGDPPEGVGKAYAPHPGGYANAAELVAGLRDLGSFEISVSAYPEKHPESADQAADIDMLKRKVDNGATRALTQFFFDNDIFERYLERVRAAGITIPIVPGIMPIQNLTQLKRFAAMCGSSVPSRLDTRFAGLDDQPGPRAQMAIEVAAEQIADLTDRGIGEFHLYTMNRTPLVSGTLEKLGFNRSAPDMSGAAA